MSHHSSVDLSQKSYGSCSSKVSFSTVEFKSHAMILGDNPAASHGPPLEIHWVPMNTMCIGLDDYESSRAPRRGKQELLMPGQVRQSVLLESGYTMREITEQISRIDRERQAKSLGLTKQIMKKTKNSVAKFVGKRSA